MTQKSNSTVDNVPCKDSACTALATPGRDYCTVHSKMLAQGVADARRRLAGHGRPLKARRGDPHVSDWLPLDFPG